MGTFRIRWAAGPLLTAALCFFSAVSALAQGPAGVARPLTVITEPKASVWINGVRFGTAGEDGKLLIRRPPTGRKTVVVRAAGFKDSTKPVLVNHPAELTVPLTKTSDEAELLRQQGDQLSGTDRAKAIQAYEKAAELRPKYREAYIGLARVLLDAGNFDKAEKALKNARASGPATPEISAIEGRFFKSVGEEDTAIASFKRAIREGGGFQPEAYAGLGLLYKDRAEAAGSSGDFRNEAVNYTEAAKYLSTAIEQLSGAPDSVVIYQTLGLIFETQNKLDEAISLYEEFLRLFPGHPESAAFESFIVQLKKQ